MDDACADHVLTSDEREAFERDGCILVPGVLDDGAVERYRALCDRYDADYRQTPGVNEHAVLNLHDLIGRDDAFLDLVDAPRTFPKVFGVLGWNIQLFHTQLVVTPPSHPDAPHGPYGWHQDNNRMNRDFETETLHPRVSVKVAYFLTDLPEPGMGNLCVALGSHLERHEPVGSATEITARAGDALLFDRRIWHSASANHSDVTRRVLFYGYSYRWLRTKSAMDFPDVLDRTDPIRRQLLGWATSANGYFEPQEADVPLRAWISRHLGPEAVAA